VRSACQTAAREEATRLTTAKSAKNAQIKNSILFAPSALSAVKQEYI